MEAKNSFTKKKVSGSDILSAYENATFDSNGKRILSDVDYIITTIIIDGKQKVIIRDVDSDYDSVILMRLMYYTEVGFDKLIETYETIQLPFNMVESQIKEMIDTLVENENYETASILTNQWDKYIKK